MAVRKPRNNQRLARKPPKRAPYERILIVCEGSRTEPSYFEGLIKHYRLSSANISVDPSDGSDPLSDVSYAKTLQARERRKGDAYDAVYCVFDRDEHANFDSACDKLAANRFFPARSWPCFEFWLLLHFSYSRTPYVRTGGTTGAQNCIKALLSEMPDYSKNANDLFSCLAPLVETGISNAERVATDVATTGEPNPSTEAHQLVRRLINLTRDSDTEH